MMIRKRAVIKYLGYILLFNAIFLCISTVISFVHDEDSTRALLFSTLLTLSLGVLPWVFVEKIEEITFHEGLSISVMGWVITCVTGMIPYYVWGGEFTLVNAFFESVSGYTTTGASILNDVESLPKGLMFWRLSTAFIGGVGVILFVLLILPGRKGIQASFYRSEVSNLSKMNFRTRSREIIPMIATVYFSLIIVETILLKLLGMTLFDAVCHSFSTVATSGFSTKNQSISAYDNGWIEVVIMVFMLVSSMHFGLIYATMTNKKINIFTSRPTRVYAMIVLLGILLITFQLARQNIYGWGDSLRYASFQVISLVSTTGFATIDTAGWPVFSMILLIYFSLQCGMVGSTTGGIKFDRLYLFFKSVKKQLRSIIHPDAIYIVRLDKITVDQNLELQIIIYIVIYLITMLITTLLLAATGIDGITSLSASIATIGNVGPGFGNVSSLSNYGSIPTAAKYILSVNMLLGRLEIMNILALFLLMFKKD